MNSFKANAALYALLLKVVRNTQVFTVVDLEKETPFVYPRMKSSSFVITEDIKRHQAAVTAHFLDEYSPSRIGLETLMLESDKLPIDELLDEIWGG